MAVAPTSRKLGLTRDQLAAFLGDHEQIKQFENLFALVDEEVALNKVTEATILAGNANARAQQALDTLDRIARALEILAAAPTVQNNNSVATDYVDLNERAPVPVDKPGRAYWNRDDGTMDVDLYGGSVLQVGQEIMYYAKNTSGSLIANGTPVMFTGTVGASGKLTFGLAVADGTVPAEYMMGVATQDIAQNDFGYVTSFGLVRGFNTTGSPYGEVWADGDLLYFSATTPGAWTKVQPQAPRISVPVAVVVNAGSGGSGSIFVRMEQSESLNNLQDVHLNGGATPKNKDYLSYDLANKRWQNYNYIDVDRDDGANAGTFSVTGSYNAALNVNQKLGGAAYRPLVSLQQNGVTLAEYSADPDGTTRYQGFATTPVHEFRLNSVIKFRITTTGTRVYGPLELDQTTLVKTVVALGDGAGASTGTLTNAPVAGNPTKWIPIDDNGTIRYIPAW